MRHARPRLTNESGLLFSLLAGSSRIRHCAPSVFLILTFFVLLNIMAQLYCTVMLMVCLKMTPAESFA
jgi:hypothetical protein